MKIISIIFIIALIFSIGKAFNTKNSKTNSNQLKLKDISFTVVKKGDRCK
jgi:hypothetical protein